MKINTTKSIISPRLYAVILFLLTCPANATPQWPHVSPVNVMNFIDASANKILLKIPLLDEQGKQVYLFICRGGSQKYLDSLYNKIGIVLVPPLNCALYLNEENEESLLSEDDSPSWHSRGQIYFQDIIGNCGNYPEWGAIRNFNLRGFKLTIKIENVTKNSTGKLVGFDMSVTLIDKPDEITPKARQTGFLQPENHVCNVIRKGFKSLKCRNPSSGYSWIDCPAP